MPIYADDRRIDQFCHDLAIALRRISGKSAEIDMGDIPVDSGLRNDVSEQSKPSTHVNGGETRSS